MSFFQDSKDCKIPHGAAKFSIRLSSLGYVSLKIHETDTVLCTGSCGAVFSNQSTKILQVDQS